MNLKTVFWRRRYGRSTSCPSKILRRLRFWLAVAEVISLVDRPVRAIFGTKSINVRKLAARRM